MKKQLLLPILFIALLFSGCKEPDDDVDMPVPEKSVEELIQGDWVHYEEETEWYPYETSTKPDLVLAELFGGELTQLHQGYRLDEHFIYKGVRPLVEDGDIDDLSRPDVFYGPLSVYHIVKQKDKAYIEYLDTRWQVSTITDNTMTWRREFRNTALFEGGGVEANIHLKVDIRRFRRNQQ